jgi:hypothetical protein
MDCEFEAIYRVQMHQEALIEIENAKKQQQIVKRNNHDSKIRNQVQTNQIEILHQQTTKSVLEK